MEVEASTNVILVDDDDGDGDNPQFEHKFEIVNEDGEYLEIITDNNTDHNTSCSGSQFVPAPGPPLLTQDLMNKINLLEEQISTAQRNEDLLYHVIGRVTALETSFKRYKIEVGSSFAEIKGGLTTSGAPIVRPAAAAQSPSKSTPLASFISPSPTTRVSTAEKMQTTRVPTASSRGQGHTRIISESSTATAKLPGRHPSGSATDGQVQVGTDENQIVTDDNDDEIGQPDPADLSEPELESRGAKKMNSLSPPTRHSSRQQKLKTNHQREEQEQQQPQSKELTIKLFKTGILVLQAQDDQRKCKQCGGGRLSTHAELIKHMLEVHNKVVKYECDICRRVYENKAELKTHKRECDGETEDQPGESEFQDVLRLDVDGANADDSDPEYIPELPSVCSKDSQPSRSSSKSQMQQQHGQGQRPQKKMVKCASCPQEFPHERQLHFHLKAEHLDTLRVLQCKLCHSRAFYTAQELEEHNTHTHPVPKDPEADKASRTCTQCGKLLSHRYSLVHHLRSVHSIGPGISCEFCDQTFVVRNKLRVHQLTEHGKLSECFEPGQRIFRTPPAIKQDSFPCSNCGKEFKRKYRLVDHIPGCHGLRPYLCEREDCGKSYKTKRHLKEHVENLHERIICHECGKEVRQRSYQAHLLKHKGGGEESESNFQCRFCGRSFGFLRSLQRHELQHTAERKYVCTFCGFSFRLRYELQSHMRLHTGKPFACDLCGWTFNRPHLLAAHKVSHERGTNRAGMPRGLKKRSRAKVKKTSTTETEEVEVELFPLEDDHRFAEAADTAAEPPQLIVPDDVDHEEIFLPSTAT